MWTLLIISEGMRMLAQKISRQQIRQEQRKKTPTYNYTESQLKGIIDNLVNERQTEIRIDMLNKLFATACVVLHDKNGWAKKRLTRFLEQLNTQFECVNDGHIVPEDLFKMCDALGVRYIIQPKK